MVSVLSPAESLKVQICVIRNPLTFPIIKNLESVNLVVTGADIHEKVFAYLQCFEMMYLILKHKSVCKVGLELITIRPVELHLTVRGLCPACASGPESQPLLSISRLLPGREVAKDAGTSQQLLFDFSIKFLLLLPSHLTPHSPRNLLLACQPFSPWQREKKENSSSIEIIAMNRGTSHTHLRPIFTCVYLPRQSFLFPQYVFVFSLSVIIEEVLFSLGISSVRNRSGK